MKPKKLVFSAKAKDDLANIRQYYLQNESQVRASKVMASIRENIKAISTLPYAYAIDPDARPIAPTIRRAIVHGTYPVCNQVEDQVIYILRITHSALNPGGNYGTADADQTDDPDA